MNSATGTLICLDKSPGSVKTGLGENAVISCSSTSSSLLVDPSENLNLQLCDVDGNTNHGSPPCGVLVDLDFNIPTPLKESDLGEVLMHCKNSKFSEKSSDDLTLLAKPTGKKASSRGSSRNTVNFSWSPSAIYSDADLLENEKFDFNLSLSSISPYKENDDAFLMDEDENDSQKSSYEEKPKKLSTPPNEWSLLNGAFISEISEEASKVVKHLSAKKTFLSKLETSTREVFTSMDSSSSVSQHVNSRIKKRDFILNERGKYALSENCTYPCVPLVCTDFETLTECAKNKSEMPNEMENKFGTELMGTGTDLLEEKCRSLDECIMSNLNAVQEEAQISSEMNAIVNTENKENHPVKDEGVAYVNYCSIANIADSSVNSEQLIPKEQSSCKIPSSLCSTVMSSPLLRRETFAVKPSPLQISNKNTKKKGTVKHFSNVNDIHLKETKNKLSVPKVMFHKVQRSSSSSKCDLLPPSMKTDESSPTMLTCKDACTVNTRPNSVNLPGFNNQPSSDKTSYNTSRKVSRISSVAQKIKSLSLLKVTSKSRNESSSGNIPDSFSEFPKESSGAASKTPAVPKKTNLLPSKLSYNQSLRSTSSCSKLDISIKKSSQKVSRANSFQFAACSTITGLSSKKISAQVMRPRASSASEIGDIEITKSATLMKSNASLSNTVKTAVTRLSGRNKGKVKPPACRGLSIGHVNADVKPEQAEHSKSFNNPKSGFILSKPRI